MIVFAILTSRWFLRLLLLALFLTLSAGMAVALKGENYAALAVGVLFGFFFWWCAVFGPPEWADGQKP